MRGMKPGQRQELKEFATCTFSDKSQYTSSLQHMLLLKFLCASIVRAHPLHR